MNMGVSACATCDGFFFRDQDVCIVGGGDTAMEEALYLANLCKSVTIIHRRDAFRASKIMQERAINHEKIKVAWNSVIEEILDVSKGEVTAVRVRDTQSGDERLIECQGVFIAIGHKPNTEIFQGMMQFDELGYIVTKPGTVETGVPGVFACGDVQDHQWRQAITAAGTGCMAALSAERWLGHEGLL